MISFRMPVLKVLLFIVFMASNSLSEQEALEPFKLPKEVTTSRKTLHLYGLYYEGLSTNCTGVEDFTACLGNTESFCPTNISCQCKNEKPFCRCDYFRVDWKEYWYMGPKCNHLWNTLDLILVAVLPAVALVIILLAIFYCVYYCKIEKAVKQTNPYREAQHNPAFTAEMADGLGHGYQQSPRGVWAGQIPKPVLSREDFDDVPTPSQLGNYSLVHPQPFRSPDPATDRFPNQQLQYEKFGSPSNNFPYADYAERRRYGRY